MKKLKFLARMGIPALVLGMLTGYADYIEGTGRLPLSMILALTLVMGFLIPKGKWRWTILIGAGVHLAHISGHLIDSSPIPPEHQVTFNSLMRDLIPALIGTYTGIFAHRYFFQGDTWHPKGAEIPSDAILHDLETLAFAIEEKKKLEEEAVAKGLVDPSLVAKEKVDMRLVATKPKSQRAKGKLDPEALLTEAMLKPKALAKPSAKPIPKAAAAAVSLPAQMNHSPLASASGFSWPEAPRFDLIEKEKIDSIEKTVDSEKNKNIPAIESAFMADEEGQDALEQLEAKLGLKPARKRGKIESLKKVAFHEM